MPLEPDQYQVELVRERATLRILLRGDIDMAAQPALERLLAELDPSSLDRLVVDLREVTFLDSTGLNVAQRFDRWGQDHEVTVVFTRAIAAVMRSLQAAGLTQTLTFSDAPEDQLETNP